MIVGIIGIPLGFAVALYGLLRPRSDFALDRKTGFLDPGWPVTPVVARLPLPLARGVWFAIGLMILAGAVLSLVGA